MKKLHKYFPLWWAPFLFAAVIGYNVVSFATFFRPTPGAGGISDGVVTSDGNNIFSGTNTFEQTVTISNAAPLFELQDTTASEDDFYFRINASGFSVRNEQDDVTYITVDNAHLLTLGSTSGGTLFQGSNGSVTIEAGSPIFEFSDSTAAEDDFLFRTNTSQLTLENENDSITYLTIASNHDVTLGSASGQTAFSSSGAFSFGQGITSSAAIAWFEVQDTTAGEDDFLMRADSSIFTISNETDSATYLAVSADQALTLGSSAGTTTLNSSASVTSIVPVSVDNATPLFELSDSTVAEDDFLLRAQTSQFTLENETDSVTYMTIASTHNLSLGSSSGLTTLDSSGAVTANAIVTSNAAAPIFELQDSTGAEDDFLLSANASIFTISNETDSATYLAVSADQALTLGSSAGTTTLNSSASVTSSVPVTIDNATPRLELQDTTGAEDDFTWSVNTSALTLSNEQDGVDYFAVASNHDVTLGSVSGVTNITSNTGASIFLRNGEVWLSDTSPTLMFEDTDSESGTGTFRMLVNANRFTLRDVASALDFFDFDINNDLFLGTTSGLTYLTSSSEVRVNMAKPYFVLRDTTASEDDFLLAGETSTFSLQNQTDAVQYFGADANHDILVGNSSDSGLILTADAGGIMYGAAMYPRVVTGVDAANITWDASKGNEFRFTLAGNRSISGGTGARDGQKVVLEFIQDGTGGRTITYSDGQVTNFRFGTDLVTADCALASGANRSSYVAIIWNAVDSYWDVVSCVRGF